MAFRVNEDKLGLDFASITKRLFVLLEYPPVGGEVANLRAGAFERATQDMIDGTRWSPPDSLKLYRGRHLRLGGEQIGEVDAIAELDGTCILVSCKSRVYTADYDRALLRRAQHRGLHISRCRGLGSSRR